MGLINIVLYAEGPRETAGVTVSGGRDAWGVGRRAAGEVIPEEEQGPGHVLVRRILVEERGAPEGAIQFEEGLKDGRARVPRGSQLLRQNTLRKLLRWANPARAPQLVIVLVDRDGARGRREELRLAVRDLDQAPCVIAVAREEFEAWLIADEGAAACILGRPVARSPDPESLDPGVAKATFNEWLALGTPGEDQARIRRRIAERCKLGLIKGRCKAFEQFLDDLAEVTL